MRIKRKYVIIFTIWCLTVLCAVVFIILQRKHYDTTIASIQNATVIIVSKQEMKLRLINYQGTELLSADIACGINTGDKQKQGDMKTPEGVFKAIDIQDASQWGHDFRDGKGEIKGAYGPIFIRLETPGHKGIGIHGTHDSLSIGTRATEGCIRLANEKVTELASLIQIPTTVIITPSVEDIKSNQKKAGK